jgi:hypothetical protein
MSTTSINNDIIPVKNEAGEIIGSAPRAQFIDSLTSCSPLNFEITDTGTIQQVQNGRHLSVSAGYHVADPGIYSLSDEDQSLAPPISAGYHVAGSSVVQDPLISLSMLTVSADVETDAPNS